MDGRRDNHRDGDRETGAGTEGGDTARRTGKGLWKTNSISTCIYLLKGPAVIQSHPVHKKHFCHANILHISSVVTGQILSHAKIRKVSSRSSL